MHVGSLLATVVIGITLAFAFGLLANRLKITPIAGYLLAGVAVGPFTPGFVADQTLAAQLADIGVILLMFGVGLHFSFSELISLRFVTVPGALGQIAITSSVGTLIGVAFGWPASTAFIFGLSLAVASTVVLLRALQDRRLLETERGRIAIGWLIVEDLAMVFALVLVPAVASVLAPSGPQISGGLGVALLLTVGKVVAFAAIMLVVGRRLIPLLLHYVAHTGSRELFRLAVLAIALGVAFCATWLFGISFALGAFFAGMVLSESQLSQQAAQETLPLRDAFAVLFFVSVGMLFNPNVIVEHPAALMAALAIVFFCKSIVSFSLAQLLGQPIETALTLGASLAQIGEFSLILVAMSQSLGLIPPFVRDIIVATSILTILLNPLVFAVASRVLNRWGFKTPAPATVHAAAAAGERGPSLAQKIPSTTLSDHTILVGYGRVGSSIGAMLKGTGQKLLVIEDRDEAANHARRDGAEVIFGNAADPQVLKASNLTGARNLLITIPQAFEAGQILDQARMANPHLKILARAHSDAEVEHLNRLGATRTVMGEAEIARVMVTELMAAAKVDA